jgi:hypothetical protein
MMTIFSRRVGVLLIGLVLSLTIVLVVAVFVAPDSGQNLRPTGGDLISIPLKPSIQLGAGVQDDFSSSTGPWWITDDLSYLVLENSQSNEVGMSFDLSVNMGVCNSNRVVTITLLNQSSRLKLSLSKPSISQRIDFLLPAASSTNLVIQISGPACQAPNDPRIFFGQLAIGKFKIYEP